MHNDKPVLSFLFFIFFNIDKPGWSVVDYGRRTNINMAVTRLIRANEGCEILMNSTLLAQ